MADAKHTPGPWHVDPKAPEESFFDDVNVLRHDGLAVCVFVHNGDITPEEAEANARLVAAAPDMLSALQWVVDQMCEGFCSNFPTAGTYKSDMDGDCAACRSRAAIAKATGSQPQPLHTDC